MEILLSSLVMLRDSSKKLMRLWESSKIFMYIYMEMGEYYLEDIGCVNPNIMTTIVIPFLYLDDIFLMEDVPS